MFSPTWFVCISKRADWLIVHLIGVCLYCDTVQDSRRTINRNIMIGSEVRSFIRFIEVHNNQ